MSRWTAAEDAALLDHFCDHGGSWDGWDELLPGRSRAAIWARAHSLGIRMSKAARSESHSRGQRARFDERWRDPYEGIVVRLMARGKTCAEIDEMHHRHPGTARRVLVARWERTV